MATALEPAPAALAGGRRLYLKREDEHELGAFKWRGALPVLEGYKAAGASTVVTASTGNHGAATAWAAARLGLEAVVFVPEHASATKVARIEELGAEIRPAGADMDEAKALGLAEARRRGVPFFEDGAEPAQYEGYAAIGEEILAQLEEPPAAVVVPVGNGALLGGVGTGRPRRVAGNAPRRGRRRRRACDGRQLRCGATGPRRQLGHLRGRNGRAGRDPVRGRRPRTRSPPTCCACPSGSSQRPSRAFAAAGIRVEGSGAAGLAALPQVPDLNGPIVLVVTGRNIDEDLHEQARNQPQAFPA